jgi:hypothetical protein
MIRKLSLSSIIVFLLALTSCKTAYLHVDEVVPPKNRFLLIFYPSMLLIDPLKNQDIQLKATCSLKQTRHEILT